jgi:hypothetical protein
MTRELPAAALRGMTPTASTAHPLPWHSYLTCTTDVARHPRGSARKAHRDD